MTTPNQDNVLEVLEVLDEIAHAIERIAQTLQKIEKKLPDPPVTKGITVTGVSRHVSREGPR